MSHREYLSRAQKPIPAAQLATAVLGGVERNRAVIIAPRSAHVQWLLQRALPGLVAWQIVRYSDWGRGLAGESELPEATPVS